MVKPGTRRWVDYVIFGLALFLIFCLIFESYLDPPELISWLGRWHPLILHFPIVLLLLVILQFLFAGRPNPILLQVAVVSTLLTAITGFFLGLEVVQKGDLLIWHQRLGAGLAILVCIWYGLFLFPGMPVTVNRVIGVLLIGIIGITGHYGGMITHGESFLDLPGSQQLAAIPENPQIYGHVVTHILEQKCISCHNANKMKGGLDMTDLPGLMKGGESGKVIVPGNPASSELIRRIHLPEDSDEHMPPEGKASLTEVEISILEEWIAMGVPDTLRLEQLPSGAPLVALIDEMVRKDPAEKWNGLPVVRDTTIRNLSSDYLTIARVSGTSNALKLNMYMPPEYSPDILLNVTPLAGNIVELDLSGLPIGNAELGFVAQCTNLEWLELDRTPISELDSLENLKKLRFLKLYGTGIGDSSIPVIKDFPNLQHLYIWDTRVSESELEGLRRERPDLILETGIPDSLQTGFESDSLAIRTK